MKPYSQNKRYKGCYWGRMYTFVTYLPLKGEFWSLKCTYWYLLKGNGPSDSLYLFFLRVQDWMFDLHYKLKHIQMNYSKFLFILLLKFNFYPVCHLHAIQNDVLNCEQPSQAITQNIPCSTLNHTLATTRQWLATQNTLASWRVCMSKQHSQLYHEMEKSNLENSRALKMLTLLFWLCFWFDLAWIVIFYILQKFITS